MKDAHSPRYVPAAGRPAEICVAEGDLAPEFGLPNADGRPVALSDLRGQWVVLYFYPEDHTVGCTLEAKRFRTYFESIAIHRAAIVGVSRDNPGNHCSFRDKHDLPFELLSDEENEAHDLYGAWRAPLLRRGVLEARRCTFLIDPRGRIAKIYPRVNPLSHAQQVVIDLEKLVSLGKHATHVPTRG